MKFIPYAVAAGLVALVNISSPLAATANADEPFIPCPDGRTGVATSVTSCAFAHNVRSAYLNQPGPLFLAYSPTTGNVYEMQCQAGFQSTFTNGLVVSSARCVGGNDAVVVVW